MATQLERMLAHTRLDVRERRARADLALLERQAAAHRPRGFEAALRRTAESGTAVIAELKKASPSRGLIRADFDPVAPAAVEIPCLRKDFMVDAFQVLEARAAGADAILLIVAALEDAELKDLYAEARRMELDVLCEIHDHEELERAVALGFGVIGVNSRNLHTMQVDAQTQIELAQSLPSGALRVAESGIRSAADIARMAEAGFDAFLV